MPQQLNRRNKRFTIYDVMEDKGYFDSNPANANALGPNGEALYKGPVPFPKLLYSPTGETRVSVAATAETTPFGPAWLGEQRELISRTVNSQDELDEALAEGWHDHPAKAVRANIEKNKSEGRVDNRTVPPISTAGLVAEKENEIERLKRELAKAQEALRMSPQHPSPKSISKQSV